MSFETRFFIIVTIRNLFRLERPAPPEMELESGEETKVPSVAEARARFDQAEGVPPHKISRAEIEPKGLTMAAKVEPKPAPAPEYLPRKVVPPTNKQGGPKPIEEPDITSQGAKSPSPRLLINMFLNNNAFRNLLLEINDKVFDCSPG